jgi:hypothetical protein
VWQEILIGRRGPGDAINATIEVFEPVTRSQQWRAHERLHRSLPVKPFSRAGVRKFANTPGWVELAGVEPASSSVEPGLLRVQFVLSLFSAPALPRTGRRRAQSR